MIAYQQEMRKLEPKKGPSLFVIRQYEGSCKGIGAARFRKLCRELKEKGFTMTAFANNICEACCNCKSTTNQG